jgi:hypothetical protein
MVAVATLVLYPGGTTMPVTVTGLFPVLDIVSVRSATVPTLTLPKFMFPDRPMIRVVGVVGLSSSQADIASPDRMIAIASFCFIGFMAGSHSHLKGASSDLNVLGSFPVSTRKVATVPTMVQGADSEGRAA